MSGITVSDIEAPLFYTGDTTENDFVFYCVYKIVYEYVKFLTYTLV
jgi:hypothetical protein